MKIIAETDSKHYSFYQRRLAEFQSRIESTVDIGRYLLENQDTDLTGAEGAWIRAAVPGVYGSSHVWKVWFGDTNALKAALDEAQRRGWLILLDSWTPPEIRRSRLLMAIDLRCRHRKKDRTILYFFTMFF